MNRRDIVLGLIILAIVGALVYFARRPSVSPSTSPTPSVSEQIQQKFNVQVPENSDNIELKDVSGGTGSALASRTYENGKYTLMVLADLPDPSAGSFYEVWLEKGNQGESDYSIVRAGSMTIAKGGYILDFSTNQDYTSYTKIVVSQEKSITQSPTTRILEGSY